MKKLYKNISKITTVKIRPNIHSSILGYTYVAQIPALT